MAAWIKMPIGMELGLGPGDFIVLDGDPATPSPKGGGAPKFSAHVYCGQTAGWTKMVLGMEIRQGDFALDGDPAPAPKGGGAPVPNFRPISIVAKRLDASRFHYSHTNALQLICSWMASKLLTQNSSGIEFCTPDSKKKTTC